MPNGPYGSIGPFGPTAINLPAVASYTRVDDVENNISTLTFATPE
jgi:hypothetical protein